MNTKTTEFSYPDISIFPDKMALAKAAAKAFVESAQHAIEENGRFSVVLAGGGTPKDLHKLVGSSNFKDKIDWSKVSIFFGDERFVPHDHKQSNYLQAYDSLLENLKDTKVTVYAIPTKHISAEEAAQLYEDTLHSYFDIGESNFDLVFLGIGPDGHTASLFPNHTLVTEASEVLVQVLHDSPKPPSTRLTLSYKSINAAKDVIILAAGENKRPVMENLLDESVAINDLPVKGIQPINGRVRWFVDEAFLGEDLLEKISST